jgi:hypothetical protein
MLTWVLFSEKLNHFKEFKRIHLKKFWRFFVNRVCGFIFVISITQKILKLRIRIRVVNWPKHFFVNVINFKELIILYIIWLVRFYKNGCGWKYWDLNSRRKKRTKTLSRNIQNTGRYNEILPLTLPIYSKKKSIISFIILSW